MGSEGSKNRRKHKTGSGHCALDFANVSNFSAGNADDLGKASSPAFNLEPWLDDLARARDVVLIGLRAGVPSWRQPLVSGQMVIPEA